MTSKPILKIAIRGHVRDSFSTNKLYEFLKRLTQMYDTQFYIHTWDVKQVSMSWRPMKDDPTPVTEHRINTYFRDLAKNIKVIFIENDSEARLSGNTEGKLASTRTPVLGWKRYVYSQFRVLEHLYLVTKDEHDFLLNMRFDLFSNSYVFPMEEVVRFVIKSRARPNLRENVFMRDGMYCGVDNIFAGTIKSNYEMLEILHDAVDELVDAKPDIKNPEFFFPIANELLKDGWRVGDYFLDSVL
ncbi:hypothetical protein ATCVCan0610SP_087R [Acanthocystis turfacea Chlorella virus Can0610SP]|nr:hypothetical protein ATCVCan0610SP_087R [Acanthocystis turfacea Chlorella virus Can0610SP]